MNRPLKITLISFAGLAVIGTGWYLIDRQIRKGKVCPTGSHKDENGKCVPDEVIPPSGGNTGGGGGGGQIGSSGGNNTSSGNTGNTSNTNTTPPPVQSTAMFSGFRIGQNLFAWSSPTNLYKQPTASSASFYKGLQKNAFVGTYLGTNMGVSGDYIKVAVEEQGTFGKTAKELYVRKGSVAGVK